MLGILSQLSYPTIIMLRLVWERTGVVQLKSRKLKIRNPIVGGSIPSKTSVKIYINGLGLRRWQYYSTSPTLACLELSGYDQVIVIITPDYITLPVLSVSFVCRDNVIVTWSKSMLT